MSGDPRWAAPPPSRGVLLWALGLTALLSAFFVAAAVVCAVLGLWVQAICFAALAGVNVLLRRRQWPLWRRQLRDDARRRVNGA